MVKVSLENGDGDNGNLEDVEGGSGMLRDSGRVW